MSNMDEAVGADNDGLKERPPGNNLLTKTNLFREIFTHVPLFPHLTLRKHVSQYLPSRLVTVQPRLYSDISLLWLCQWDLCDLLSSLRCAALHLDSVSGMLSPPPLLIAVRSLRPSGET